MQNIFLERNEIGTGNKKPETSSNEALKSFRSWSGPAICRLIVFKIFDIVQWKFGNVSLNVRCQRDQYWKWLKWLTGNVFTSFFPALFSHILENSSSSNSKFVKLLQGISMTSQFHRKIFAVLVWQIIWSQSCNCLIKESFPPLWNIWTLATNMERTDLILYLNHKTAGNCQKVARFQKKY